MNRETNDLIRDFLVLLLSVIVIAIIVIHYTDSYTNYIAIMSLFLTAIGMMFGYIALIISKRSTNAQFLNVISKFEDRRIDMVYDRLEIGVGIWKSKVDMDEAVELIVTYNIKKKYIERLVSRYNTLLEKVVIPQKKYLVIEEVKHVLYMYNQVLDFKIPNNNEDLKSVRENISKLLKNNKKTVISKDYVNSILTKIQDKEKKDKKFKYRLFIESKKKIL